MDVTYISSNQFSVDGDKTDEFLSGRRLKIVCSSTGLKYLTVYSSNYSGSITTVTTKENDITSDITTVLYGIVAPGDTGSLPEHDHSGDEGSGGFITTGGSGTSDVQSFTDLIDTPTTYSGSEGKYLKVTASGIEFADVTVSGGGTSYHDALLNLDYDSSGHTGFAPTAHEHSTFSGTEVFVAGDATVTGTMYAHIYDSYSPLIIKDGGVTVIEGDGIGSINLSSNSKINNVQLASINDVGTGWFVGEGVPDSFLGNPYDFYMESTTGRIYRRDNITLGVIDVVGLPVVWHGWYDYLSEFHEYDPYGAVDGDENTAAENPNYPPDTWLQFEVDFGADNEKAVKEITYIAKENNLALPTRTCLVLAKNNSEDAWTTVYEASNFVSEASKQTKTESFYYNEDAYRYWAFRWSKTDGANFSFLLYEIYFKDSNQYLWALRPVKFNYLDGVPSSYEEGKYLRSTSSGTEWATISGGGTSNVQSFLDLEDTPSSYDTGKYLRSTSSGIEFVSLDGLTLSGTTIGKQWFNDAADVPADQVSYLLNEDTGVISNFSYQNFSYQSSGWLSGWTYRKSITMSRASGAVADYQMKLLVGESAGATGADVDCGGHCQADFDDLRFTTSDGTTLLSYWIESVSGTTPNQLATVWVEFNFIGTSATTFYVYYGNASAAAYSNIEDTFIFGDDFEDGSIDTARWVKEKTGNSDFVEQNGRLEVIYGSPDEALNLNLKSQNTFSPEGKAYQCKARAGAAHISGTQLTLYNDSEVSVYRAFLMHESGYDYFRADRYQQSGFTVLYKESWISNIQTLEIRYPAGGDIEFYEGSIKRANESYSLAAGAINIRLTVRFLSGQIGYGTDYFEYAFIRKYVSPEPVWGAWGSEETLAIEETILGTIKPSFIDLTDTPTTYSGSTGKYLYTTSSGIEFIDGVILTAPNNSKWLLRVTNSGTLYTESY